MREFEVVGGLQQRASGCHGDKRSSVRLQNAGGNVGSEIERNCPEARQSLQGQPELGER
jgi:hypothetical protein